MILQCKFSRTLTIACIFVILSACEGDRKESTLFFKVPPHKSGVDFENVLTNSDDFNIIEYLYFYNGGGVALGDINNDGLPDIYFSSNQGSNKLYLNKGNFVFEDVTAKAGVEGVGNWKTGVTMADVNGDGLLDLFVCGVGNYKKFNSGNQLLINNGDLTFSDRTEEYRLQFKGFSTQASFFDYDNDGDLDMYLVNHSVHTRRSYGPASLRFQTDSLAGDKLYRNDLIPSGNPQFTEVTKAAGILNSQIAYGLAVGISDLDDDGFLDIYISNDFNENDYLYVNQRDGTFKQILENAIPHTSRFSMGNDIADINNDALPDIVTLDMLPKNEAVIKTTAGEDAFEVNAIRLDYGYHSQFLRNTLQINRGSDLSGRLLFSDIAPFAGVEATDWSWAPLLADFDNDGAKDLFVSNGILDRPNDLDYINFISGDSAQRSLSDDQLIQQMPSGSVPNVFFKNAEDLTFNDVSKTWIGSEPTLSNGAAYADLDNDGDLDLVINNINQKAFLYRNDLNPSNFIKLKLEGNDANRFGIGAKVIVYAGSKRLLYEQIPVRGWLSSMDYNMHIGLGNLQPDSLYIRWPGNLVQRLTQIPINKILTVSQADAVEKPLTENSVAEQSLLLEEPDILFHHKENNFTAFNIERLIPHMLSTQGPKLAIGDVNNDTRDDFFVGGAAGQSGQIFLQGSPGSFQPTIQPAIARDSSAEDMDAVFADFDGNETLDLFIVSGGQEFSPNHTNLLPRMYLNDGKGNYAKATKNLPEIFVNASCIKTCDFDGDGDIDVFIGARVVPGKYGVNPSSYLLTNNGAGIFTDESEKILGVNSSLGMISDAVWADLNNDNKPDLILVGEWMPISILIQNATGGFSNETEAYGLSTTSGWWNTITGNDFDEDGNMDFVVGNLGLNSRLRASREEPVSMVIGDIDNNNSLDHITTYYNQGRRYPFISRDQLVKQIPAMRRKFLKYSTFAEVELNDIVDPSMQERFIRKDAHTFASVYIKNHGNKKLELIPLPKEAQWFPIFSFCVEDVNGDGINDIMAAGNLVAAQPEFGGYDAGYGLILVGDEKQNFRSLKVNESGLVVRGEGRDIKSIRTEQGVLYLVSRNNDSIKLFSTRKKTLDVSESKN